MKSKSPLVMLEQLIMLLVFALAAAMCLQAFALADSQSKTTIARDAAIIEVQQAAEVIKYCGGDMERAAAILGAEGNDSVIVCTKRTKKSHRTYWNCSKRSRGIQPHAHGRSRYT